MRNTIESIELITETNSKILDEISFETSRRKIYPEWKKDLSRKVGDHLSKLKDEGISTEDIVKEYKRLLLELEEDPDYRLSQKISFLNRMISKVEDQHKSMHSTSHHIAIDDINFIYSLYQHLPLKDIKQFLSSISTEDYCNSLKVKNELKPKDEIENVELIPKHQIGLFLALGIDKLIESKLKGKRTDTRIAQIIAQLINVTHKKKIETIRSEVRDYRNKKNYYSIPMRKSIEKIIIDHNLIDLL